MTTLKLTQIGNSVGVVFPEELLTRLRVEKGDLLFVSEAPGGVTLTPYDPSLAEEVERGQEFMREFKETFQELAK